jgi:hypothetical protein
VPSLVADAPRQEQLSQRLAAVAGVVGVDTNPTTGSVLVRFDDRRLPPDFLIAAIARLLDVEDQLERGPTPLVARELRAVAASLNRAVLEQTRGIVDMRTLTMIALGAMGVRRLLNEGMGSLPAGATLLWWATNSLVGKHSDATA